MAKTRSQSKGQRQLKSPTGILPPSSLPQSITFPFMKLPPEIRNIIYLQALGHKRIHLTNATNSKGRLRHYVCPDDPSSECQCISVENLAWIQELKQSVITSVEILTGIPDLRQLMVETIKEGTSIRLGSALLRTCSQIYYEAIDFLYATNTFDVNKKPRITMSTEVMSSALFHFTVMVRPQFLDRISRLEIDWDFDYLPHRFTITREERITRSARTWSAHWDRIGRKFHLLRTLFVRIRVIGDLYWIVGRPMYWAVPMLKISHGLQTCKVILRHDGVSYTLEDLGELMCSRWDGDLCIQQELANYPAKIVRFQTHLHGHR